MRNIDAEKGHRLQDLPGYVIALIASVTVIIGMAILRKKKIG